MSDEKSKSKVTEIIKLLIDKFGREFLSETSQKEIRKEAQKRGLSDAELKDLRTKYEDLTKATGKHCETYAVRFKKGGTVKKKKNKIAGRLAMRGYGIARK